MEKCPVELLLKIAQLACTDGGYTGCSLSLVSHYIHDATKPARYLSVALTSEGRIRNFRIVLQRAEIVPVVRHLFISPFLNPDGWNKIRGGLHWEPPYFESRFESVEDKTIPTILRAVAPTLVTLFLDNVGFHETIPDRYPHLRDLCVSTLLDFFINTDAITPENCPFPSLSRLLITDGSNYMCRLGQWLNLARVAPNVAQIRIVDAQFWMPFCEVDRFFHAFLNVPWSHPNEPDGPGPDPTSTAALLGSWRGVHIHPPIRRDSMFDRMSGFSWAELRNLAREGAERGGDRVMVVGETCDYDSQKMRVDWQDLLDGGEGPWAEQQRREAKS